MTTFETLVRIIQTVLIHLPQRQPNLCFRLNKKDFDRAFRESRQWMDDHFEDRVACSSYRLFIIGVPVIFDADAPDLILLP